MLEPTGMRKIKLKTCTCTPCIVFYLLSVPNIVHHRCHVWRLPGDAAGTGDINAPFSAPTSDFSQQVARARTSQHPHQLLYTFPAHICLHWLQRKLHEGININTSTKWFIKAPVLIMLPIDTIFPQLVPGAKLSDMRAGGHSQAATDQTTTFPNTPVSFGSRQRGSLPWNI